MWLRIVTNPSYHAQNPPEGGFVLIDLPARPPRLSESQARDGGQGALFRTSAIKPTTCVGFMGFMRWCYLGLPSKRNHLSSFLRDGFATPITPKCLEKITIRSRYAPISA